MLAEVEAFDFLGPGDAQSHRGVEHFEDHKRGHNGQHPGDDDGDNLGDQHRSAFQQAQRLASSMAKVAPVARVAKTPVRIAPSVPPTPWTPKASSESSYLKYDFKARAGQKADDADGHAHQQGRHRRDEAGGRRDAHQAGHHAGARAQDGRFAADDPFHAGPGQTGRGRGKMRGAKCAGRQFVGGQGAAGIEAEPADPQHRGADGGIGQIMRRHRFAAVAQAFAQQQGTDQRRNAGTDMHHRSAGEIQGPAGRYAAFSLPYMRIPPPHTQWHKGQ